METVCFSCVRYHSFRLYVCLSLSRLSSDLSMCLTVKFRNTKGQRQTDKQTEEPSYATLIRRPFYILMQNGPQRYFKVRYINIEQSKVTTREAVNALHAVKCSY